MAQLCVPSMQGIPCVVAVNRDNEVLLVLRNLSQPRHRRSLRASVANSAQIDQCQVALHPDVCAAAQDTVKRLTRFDVRCARLKAGMMLSSTCRAMSQYRQLARVDLLSLLLSTLLPGTQVWYLVCMDSKDLALSVGAHCSKPLPVLELM